MRFRKDRDAGFPERIRIWGDETVAFTSALSREQAYHLFYLSYKEEGGSGYPVGMPDYRMREGKNAAPVRRIHGWFSDELIEEFTALLKAKVTPMDYYEEEETQDFIVTVNVPKKVAKTATEVRKHVEALTDLHVVQTQKDLRK